MNNEYISVYMTANVRLMELIPPFLLGIVIFHQLRLTMHRGVVGSNREDVNRTRKADLHMCIFLEQNIIAQKKLSRNNLIF